MTDRRQHWVKRLPGWVLPIGTGGAVGLAAGGFLVGGNTGLIAGCLILVAWFAFLMVISPNKGSGEPVSVEPYPWWRRHFGGLMLAGWGFCLVYGHWLQRNGAPQETMRMWRDSAWAFPLVWGPVDIALGALARHLAKTKS